MRLLFFSIALFLSSASFSQNVSDTIFIFITDGFENDSVDLWINETHVLYNQNLKSNLYYGLTGEPIELIKDKNHYVVKCSNYANCSSNKINLDSEIKIKLLFNERIYEEAFDLTKGKYFIIGYVGVYMDIDIWQLKFEPSFE